jgi:hypothetical protein
MINAFVPKIVLLSALSLSIPVIAEAVDKELGVKKSLNDNLNQGALIESSEGLFLIQLPLGFSDYEKEVQPIQTEMGEIETVNYTSFSDTAAAMAGSSLYPESLLIFIKGKEREVLEGAQEGALKNVSGTVISEMDVDIQSSPARYVEFTAEAEGQPLFGKALFLLNENRLYHVLLITSNPQDIHDKATTAFFESLKIN